jgi:hypothetical protein
VECYLIRRNSLNVKVRDLGIVRVRGFWGPRPVKPCYNDSDGIGNGMGVYSSVLHTWAQV